MHMPLLYLALSLLAGAFGRDRRMGFWGFFFLSLLATPMVGFIGLVLTSSDVMSKRAQRRPDA